MTITRQHPSYALAIRARGYVWRALLFVFAIGWCGVAMSAVMTDRGLVQGVREGDLTVYKGLPFAAPPIGKLRWRAPQPAAAWSGVKLLDHFAPRCMQKGMYPENAPPSR